MGKQKRSENTYQKINTLYKRDKYGVFMPYDEFVDPAFEWLKNMKFVCTEKVDGTNIRIEVLSNIHENWEEVGVTFEVRYKGKTDSANIPKKLLEFLETTYTEDVVLAGLGLKKHIPTSEFEEHRWVEPDTLKPDATRIPKMYTIYGEGYGVKIQTAGGNYLKDSNKMIGFDVKVTAQTGKELYLLDANRDEIMNKMGMPIVPVIGEFTIAEAVEFCRNGFISKVAESNPNFIAEGLVCKTPVGLMNRMGERIIFKVKTGDWNKYYAKYGTYDPVEQELPESV